MALIKFGSIITDTRGTIGGHSFKWSRWGNVLSNKPHPPERSTPAQSVIRSRYANLSKLWWSELDATQRTAWRALAAANPFPNRWGDEYPLTGLAFFIRVNQRLLAAGSAATMDAPADQTVTACTAATITATSPATASLTFSPGTVPADHKLCVDAAPPTSPGAVNPSRPYVRAANAAASQTSPLSLSSALSSLFGTLPAGRQLYVRAAFLNTDTGARSSWIIAATIIA